MSKRFTLHGHYMSGPTYKVGLMLSLCGEPFSWVLLDLPQRAHKTAEYLALNRYGQAPCLQDGDLALCQSAAILIYLAENLGKFDGRTVEDKARVREWLFWDFDKLTPGVMRSRAILRGFWKPEPQVADSLRGEGEAGLKALDEWLAEREWLVGNSPTIADIDVYGVMHHAGDAGFDLAKTGNVTAWAKRVEALPGFATRDDLLPKESRP